MGPANDHERAIAQAIDMLSRERKLSLTSIPKITAVLKFMMTRSDTEFLVDYIRWRINNPVQ